MDSLWSFLFQMYFLQSPVMSSLSIGMNQEFILFSRGKSSSKHLKGLILRDITNYRWSSLRVELFLMYKSSMRLSMEMLLRGRMQSPGRIRRFLMGSNGSILLQINFMFFMFLSFFSFFMPFFREAGLSYSSSSSVFRCVILIILFIPNSQLFSCLNDNIQTMYESKVSNFSHSKFPSFGLSQISQHISPLSTSIAPGLSNTQCPSHPQYVITNICRAQTCIEPLCPECIPGHIQLHEQTKQPSKIQTIVAARVNCIQRLAEQKYYLEGDLEKVQEKYNTDPETIVAELKTTLSNSKSKLTKLIDKLYDQMNDQIEVIYSAYYAEAEKNALEARKIANPLIEHLGFVSSQKQQLESDDFISTLIEVLTEFPRRPELKQVKNIPNFGSVEVNAKMLQQVHRSIEKYTRVVVNVKQEILNNSRLINIKSNNSKFSRLSAQKSRVTDRSRSRERSIFQSKVIPPSTLSSPLESYYNQVNQYKVTYEPTRLTQVNIKQADYFPNQGMLAYFEENTRTLHTVSINSVQDGFSRRQLNINFVIPTQHRSIVTPQNQIMMFGGRFHDITTNKSFTFNGDSLFEIPSMNTQRYNFGICYHQGCVYVAGGAQSEGVCTNKFQKYIVSKKCWTVLKPCLEANQGCQLTSFNHFIVKIGGKTSNGIINTLQLYNTQTDQWISIPLNPGPPLPYSSGLVQISQNQLLVFGGYLKELKTNEVFVIRFNGLEATIQKSVQIYSDSTFTNPSIISKRSVLALQNTAKGTGKNILRFNGSSWKFVSC